MGEVTQTCSLFAPLGDCTQTGNLFRLLDDAQQKRLARNIAESMAGVPDEIVARQLGHFGAADPR